MASNVITVDQALVLYQAYLQDQFRRLDPAFKNMPLLVIRNPRTGKSDGFTYSQMIAQVQRRTPTGINEAIRHAGAIGYMVVQ